MKATTRIGTASIGLIAVLLLAHSASADGWWDGTGTVTTTAGSMTVAIAGVGLLEGDVIGGKATKTWFGTNCDGKSSNFRFYHFTIETDLGTVKGDGLNEAATWTWNGILFEGTVGVSFTPRPGAWSSDGSVSLQGHSVGLPSITFDLTAQGPAAGTYAHGPCEADSDFRISDLGLPCGDDGGSQDGTVVKTKIKADTASLCKTVELTPPHEDELRLF